MGNRGGDFEEGEMAWVDILLLAKFFLSLNEWYEWNLRKMLSCMCSYRGFPPSVSFTSYRRWFIKYFISELIPKVELYYTNQKFVIGLYVLEKKVSSSITYDNIKLPSKILRLDFDIWFLFFPFPCIMNFATV